MNNAINILVLEDESLTIYSIKKALEHLSKSDAKRTFNIKISKNCDFALNEIKQAINGTSFDLVLLNIDVPVSNTKTLISAEDIALTLKDKFPKVKTIVLAAYCNNLKINTILTSFNPDSLLIKSDIDFKELVNAIDTVLMDTPYYSKTVLQLLRRRVSNDFVLDKVDKLILYHLSRGAKTKDLPNLINLSKGGVERRKRHLKEVFNIEKGDDQKLLQCAEKNGFI